MEIINPLHQKIIREKGRPFLINHIKSFFDNKESNLNSINNSFFNYFKDLKRYKETHKFDEMIDSCFKTFKMNKSNVIIFEIEYEDKDYDINNVTIPYGCFYIATNIFFELDDDVITINGFYIFDFNDYLNINYFWSKTISDGWGFCNFVFNTDSLNKKINDLKIQDKIESYKFDGFKDKKIEQFDNVTETTNPFYKKLNEITSIKFFKIIKKLLYLVNNKEYSIYKKFNQITNKFEVKEIIYDSDVMSHKRHFWKDSGYFKIPDLEQKEWEAQGYKTHECVSRKDGKLYFNVPYIDIGNYKIERQEKLKENKIINLIEKKQWQKEQFLGSILYKLYPSIYIKRHDRKKLNGLELDYYIPELQIAFEYDGEQHFDKNLCENIFQSNFEELQKRDRKKNIKCRDLGIKLIRIKYDEPLTLRHIKKKLEESP